MMIKRGIQRAAHAVGLEIHRRPKKKLFVEDFYPFDPIPRWGYGKPPHARITDILNRQRSEFSAVLDRLSRCTEVLASVPLDGDPDSLAPYWNDAFFGNLDAAVLVTMLVSTAPVRYVEIGSGHSTKLARHAVESAHLSTSIISLDPKPRATIDGLCDRIIRQRLETSDLSLFDELEAGDILFFDGSHRIFTNSDVTVFFLEIMPRLKPGVIVHIHDIFLPWDYPPEWKKRMYSEQYVLATMLLCRQQFFKVLLPLLFVSKDAELSSKVLSMSNQIGCIAQGSSFWIEMV
jgi:methyltransferase family protein